MLSRFRLRGEEALSIGMRGSKKGKKKQPKKILTVYETVYCTPKYRKSQ
jgi:hypothetical protein